MAGYALVKDGKVINLILWDGSEMEFEDGVTAVEIEKTTNVSIGFKYENGEFIQPPLSDEEKETNVKNWIISNISEKTQRMNYATQKITVLEDAIELEMATEEEITDLPLWKKYRVLLNRVDVSKGEKINWPEAPK